MTCVLDYGYFEDNVATKCCVLGQDRHSRTPIDFGPSRGLRRHSGVSGSCIVRAWVQLDVPTLVQFSVHTHHFTRRGQPSSLVRAAYWRSCSVARQMCDMAGFAGIHCTGLRQPQCCTGQCGPSKASSARWVSERLPRIGNLHGSWLGPWLLCTGQRARMRAFHSFKGGVRFSHSAGSVPSVFRTNTVMRDSLTVLLACVCSGLVCWYAECMWVTAEGWMDHC